MFGENVNDDCMYPPAPPPPPYVAPPPPPPAMHRTSAVVFLLKPIEPVPVNVYTYTIVPLDRDCWTVGEPVVHTGEEIPLERFVPKTPMEALLAVTMLTARSPRIFLKDRCYS